MSLSHDDLREILRLLDASNFDELELETGGFRLVVRRGGAGPEAVVAQSRGADSPTPPARRPEPAAPVIVPPSVDLAEIRAPLLGTFYRAPKPGAPPFVDVGARVRADTVIGIVEVMKLMNPVTAGVAGEIREVLVADGQLVEYDQLLMRVQVA